MSRIETGCVDIWLDEIVPCLKDVSSGEIKETCVYEIMSRSILKNFREDNGWEINWKDLPSNVQVFKLALKENDEIQGLVGIKNDISSRAAYIHWACTAPQNNKHRFGAQKYSGVGGHLFAIAADMSMKWGYDGFIFGFALNKELLKHYIDSMGAEHLPMLHEYQFFLKESAAKRLLETYTYEWNE